MNDLVTLQDAIRNKVKETVMSAIPSETIDKIVKDYFEGEFKSFIREELQKALRERFIRDVQDQSNTLYDKHGKYILTNLAKEVGESIMEGFAKTICYEVMQRIRNNTY